MKKYIAPAFNVVNLNAEESFLLSVSGELSSKPQLSNKMEESDWDDEE